MPGLVHVSTTINGNPVDFLCEPRQSLLECLRDVVGMTGTKEGCNDGNCGACTVNMDGRIDLNEWNSDIPFYLEIDQRLFALQPSNTHLVSGHGAQLPNWITNEESEGRLTILVERNERYLVYIHDTLAIDEDEDEDEDDETIVEESTEETSE